MHWIDPTSPDLLENLLPLTDTTPLRLIAAYRPHATREAASHYGKALDHLDETEAPADLVRQIIVRYGRSLELEGAFSRPSRSMHG